MQSIPISVEGFQKLRQELEELKKERPEVIQAIKEAREEGDLRENAGYDAAKDRQGMLEARINYIESRLPRCDVIDIQEMQSEKVAFGATVEIEDMDSGERKRFTLLGPDEADYKKSSVSVHSPLARALLGKEAGDDAVVEAPKGRIEYEIISVEYKGFPEGHFD
ncbi:MAG: transcription elongation factor GreA [Desulfohalobiaceae bacterium]